MRMQHLSSECDKCNRSPKQQIQRTTFKNTIITAPENIQWLVWMRSPHCSS